MSVRITIILSCCTLLLSCLLATTAQADPQNDLYKPTGNGCQVFDYDTNWNPGETHATSYEWSGPCVKGYAENQGELKAYWDGKLDDTTEGTMSHGKLTGQAITLSPDGTNSIGSYLNGRPNGHFVMKFPNGSRYEGGVLNGHFSGQGKVTRADGSTAYEGGFNLGSEEGHGVSIETDGTRYEGNFTNNKPNGQGIVTLPNGRRVECTAWSNGHMDGYCVRTDPDGSRYGAAYRNGDMVEGSNYQL